MQMFTKNEQVKFVLFLWLSQFSTCSPMLNQREKKITWQNLYLVELLPNKIDSPLPQLQPNLIPGLVNMKITSNDIYESALTVTR